MADFGEALKAQEAARTKAAPRVEGFGRALLEQREEEAARATHAARPATTDIIDNITGGGPHSIWDTTIDLIGTVTNPINDAWDATIGAATGLEGGRITDHLKSGIRNTETGFKLEEGARRTALELKMIPAVPAMVYGLAGALVDYAVTDDSFKEAMLSEEGKDLVNKANDGDAGAVAKLREDPNAVLRNGLGWSMDWYDDAADATGVADREGRRVPLDEDVMGIIGSSFIGLPGGIIRGLTGKLVSTFGKNAATRIATNIAASRSGRVAGRIAEVVTPLTLPLTPANVGLNVAGGVAVNDVMRGVLGEDTATGELYNKVTGTSPGELIATAGAVAGGAALFAALMKGRKGSVTRALTGSIDDGRLPPSSVRSLETELFDVDEPMVGAVRNLYGSGDETAEAFEDTVRLSTRNGGETRINMVWTDGIAPGAPGTRYTDPGANIVRAFDVDLSDAEKRVLNEGVMAMDADWSIKAGRGSPTPWSQAEIDDRIKDLTHALTVSPKMRKLYDAYRTHMREILEHAHAAGFFTKKQMQEMRTRPYMPNIPVGADPPKSAYDMLFGSNSEGRFANQAVNPFVRTRQGNVQQMVAPFSKESLGSYEKAMTKSILENRTRKRFVQLMRTGKRRMRKRFDEIFPHGDPIRKKKPNESAGNTVTIFENGKKVDYVVGDPQLRNSLLFAPHTVVQSLSDMRRAFQMGTTGELNPFFAARSLMIDTFFSSTMVRRSEAAGLMDAAMHSLAPTARHTMLGDVASAALRPADALLTAATGVGRGLWHRGLEELANQFDQRVGMTLGNLFEQIDPSGALRHRASKWALNEWHKTTSYQMRSVGYAPGRFTADIGDMAPSRLDAAHRALFETNLAGRTYRGVLNSIRDGYRLEYFAQNQARLMREGMTPHAATKRAARLARQVGSDPTQAGANQNINKINSTIPYANIGVQAMGTVYRAFRDRRLTPLMVLGAHAGYSLAATGMIFDMGDRAAEWWYNEVPDRVRARGLPLNPTYIAMRAAGRADEYVFDKEDMVLIDIGLELAPARAFVTSYLHAFAGFDTPEKWRDKAVQANMSEMGASIWQLVPWGAPQIANLGYSLFDYGPIDDTRLGSELDSNRGLFREPQRGAGYAEDRRFTGANDNGGRVAMTDRWADVFYSLVGTAGSFMADMIEQVEAYTDITDGEMSDALDTVYDRASYKADRAVTTMLRGFDAAPTRQSPSIDRAYTIRQELQPLKEELDKALFRVVGQRTNPISFAEIPMRFPAAIQDPALRGELQTFVVSWNKNPIIGRAFDDLTNLRVKYEGVEARRDLPPARQKFFMDDIVSRMGMAADNMLDAHHAIVEGMKGAYGEDWDMASFIERIKADLANAPADVVN